MRIPLATILGTICCTLQPLMAELPPGVKNSQKPGDAPIAPAEALKRLTLPEGFRATLFAGEPDVMQPIAFDFDDRGRLWVVECFSYPDFKVENRDRILIFTDQDGDGRFDERKVFLDQGRRLSGLTLGFGGGMGDQRLGIAALPGQEYRRHPRRKTRSDARRLDTQGRPQHGQRPGLGTGGLALRPPRHHHALHGRQAGHARRRRA